ncbi:O-antigen ligase family protein [Haliea sp. E17]|uniref:O-antigen ligase family protein n=1 Tax=Haliea sp. E17 TaxID=3401576 RepID=UPI003AAB391E
MANRLNSFSRRNPDGLLFYLYLALLLWMPLPLGSNRWWAVAIFELAAMGLAMGWLALYARGRVTPGETFARAAPVLLLLCLGLCWIILQAAALPPVLVSLMSPNAAQVQSLTGAQSSLSLNVSATREMVFETLALIVVFSLTLLLVTSRRRLRQLAGVLVISGVMQAAYGSLMTLSGLEYGFLVEKESYRGVATGTFVNRNHLAGYLELCLAVGIGLLLSDLARDRTPSLREAVRRFLNSMLGRKGFLRLSLAVMVIALVLTHSRMGNTAFFTALALTGLLYLVAQKRLTRGSILFFSSLLVIDLLIVGNFFGVEEVVQRLQTTSTTTEHRDEVVRESLQIIADYPLAGTGAGTYYSTYPSYARGEVSQNYDHTHNDFVEFASEWGLVGFALLGAAVAWCLFCGVQAMFQRKDPLMLGTAFASVMGLLALLVHSLADFNLQIPANAALFVVIMALGVISVSARFREGVS